MNIDQFHRANEAIRNSFAAVKQDMQLLKKELFEIRQAVAASQAFEDEANSQLDNRMKDAKDLNNQILSLKEELHNEQLQARRAINRLQQNFESIYVGIDAYKAEAQALREENKKLKALIEAFMQEIAQNKDINVSALRSILNELRIEAQALKGGVIKLAGKKGKKRKTEIPTLASIPSVSLLSASISSQPSPLQLPLSLPSTLPSELPSGSRKQESSYDFSFEPKPKKKGFFSKIIDYFAEEE